MLEKIKKLLAKAEGTNNEQEAKIFFMKAQELMAKNDISLEEVNQQQTAEVVSDIILEGKKTTAARNLHLASIIAKNFKVKTFLQGGSIRFMGFTNDVKVAKLTFDSIAKFMEKKRSQLYRQYKKEGKSTKGVRESYTTGFLTGLDKGFKENVESLALIIITPEAVVKQYEEETNGSKKKHINSKVNDSALYHKGYKDGVNFNKNRLE